MAPVLQLQRMAGNRAVAALVARDPKTKSPPAKKKDLPKHNYVAIEGMEPILFESAQFGTGQRPTNTTGREAQPDAKPVLSDVVITTYQGEHSTELFKTTLGGPPFAAEVVFVKPDGQPYLKIKLKNAMISSYSVSGHGGGADGRPMETWVLNAEKVEFETLSGGAAASSGD